MPILLNIILFLCKFIIGTISGSMAITADAWNNILDAGNSTIALLGIKIARYGKGEKHPFGHGRMEWMVSLFSSMVVMLAGYELLKTSWKSVRNPKNITVSLVVFLILIISIVIKLYMYAYYRKVAKSSDSESMKAMSVDSLCDSLATGAVLVSTIANAAFGWKIDGWCGMVVSVFIIYTGYSSISETGKRIVGKTPDKELIDKIEMLVKQYGVIENIQEMTIHDYGVGKFMVAMEIGVYEQEDSELIKGIPEDISYALYEKLGCDSVIQISYLLEDENERQIYFGSVEEIKKIDEAIQVENFRIVQAQKHKVIHVDISLPMRLEKRENEIRKIIENKICKVGKEYKAMIKFKIMPNYQGTRKININRKMKVSSQK
ncbi:cation diffusion facilitator family transporter [Clostridium felsineum]|uniref:Ferrous-iron efflux pump FieF n=2 Tax=Clostridium felsineum TaxID=36839 RepID=A0A1S8L7F1_9CLOT|nr:cation diffusion facilitator family transporter [Clostridium felsineum]URZ00285.1 Ferrous-iron efflux pump FieF [Clostridium felsineum]URZ07078.1 Ferrous-iron efflux pump FieF [Clostridium felsineum]URZ12108.1 Ferrous-iron efflux pump FieF [Clostridium felsineum]